MPRARRWTDEQLADAVAASTTMAEVCRRIGILPGRYDLLRRHIARIGADATHLPEPTLSRARRRHWTDEDLREVVVESTTVSEVLRKLGYQPSGGMHRLIVGHFRRLGIDTSHFVGRASARGRKFPNRKKASLSDVLVVPSSYRSGELRRRLIAEGIKEARCEQCGLDSWQGEPLPLALDHINGDHTDNRLENLRILCPNCHALTSTWCGRNKQAGVAQRQRRSF